MARESGEAVATEAHPAPAWADAAVVFALAFTVRLLYLVEYSRSPYFDFLHLDPRYYHDWAVRIASGEWLGREVFEQSPLYPYLLAIYFVVFGRGLMPLYLIQFATGSFTAALTCLLGRRLFGRGAGLVAGIGSALYAPLLFYEGQVMKEFLTPLLTVCTLLFLYRGLRASAEGRGRFALAGACLGIAALVRDNVLLLLPVLAAYLLAARSGRRRFLDAAALGAAGMAMLLPVAARNYAVAGEWVLTTSGGGEVFYIGNGPFATGAYTPPPWVRPNPRYEHEDFRRRAREITGRDLTRSEASRFWYREGFTTIAQAPARWPLLLLRKALLFLNDHELADNYSFYSFRAFSWVLTCLPTFGWIAAAAVVGLIASAGRWRELMPLYLVGAGYMASVLLFFNFARFRLPFIPVLLLFAGHGVMVLYRSAAALRAGRKGPSPSRALWGYGAAAAAVLAGTNLVLPGGREEPFQDRLHLAAAYRQEGKPSQAEAVLRETIREGEALLARRGWTAGSAAVARDTPVARPLREAHRDLASILLSRSRTEEAIAQLLAAAALDPNDASLFRMLGGAYRSRGDLRAAAGAYEKGLALEPASFAPRFDLATVLYEAGDPGRALRELRRARELTPDLGGAQLADWHYAMGMVLYALPARRGEAGEHFVKGLELSPSHPKAAVARSLLGSSAR